MSNIGYKRLVAVLTPVWFGIVLYASALHSFEGVPGRPPIALGLAVLTPLLAFLIWFFSSTGFRQFALSLSPRTLTFIQSWRIVGFAFVALYAAGLLPGVFALPAGWGDVAIGVTAPLAAIHLALPKYRKTFILWQILGVIDLVMAVLLGTLAGQLGDQLGSTAILTALPLSLIPTFGVPLLLIVHFICIAEALRWKEPSRSHFGALSPTSA